MKPALVAVRLGVAACAFRRHRMREGREMLTGAYRFPAMESVIYGRDFADAVKDEVERADAHAVFVLASGTLTRETELVEKLKAALGNRFAGLCAKIGSHTPRVDCVAAANV